MTIYRTTGPWGATKGSNLTQAEVDTNFYEVSTLEDAAEVLAPLGIEGVSVETDKITFEMTNGSSLGPYKLPSPRFSYKGLFQPNYPYQVGDVLYCGYNLFLVIKGFISGSRFNPADTIGGALLVIPVAGSPIYTEAQMFFPGQPDVGIIGQYVAGRRMILDKITAYFDVAPDADEIYSIRKSGADIGFITFEADSHVGVIGLSGGEVSLLAGDRISIHNVVYGTGQDMSATFRFRRVV